MTLKHLTQILTAVLLALLLAACGSSGGQDDNNNAGNGALTKETAQEIEGLAVQSLTAQMALFHNLFVPSPAASTTTPSADLATFGLLNLVQPQQDDECVTTKGDPADADHDGIPAGVLHTFNCHTNFKDISMSITGSVNMKDFFPDPGFLISYNDLKFEIIANGERTFFHANGFIKVARHGFDYIATLDFDLDYAYQDQTGSVSYDFSQTYAPDNSSDPFVSGTLTFDGDMSFKKDGERYGLSLRTDPSLRFSEGCSAGFADGAAVYTDSHGNAIRIDFNCDSYTTSYNGDPL